MLMVLTIALAVAGPPASAAPATAVPAEIEQHYREYNFVNSFSTAGERHTIASGIVGSDRRLARVARLMRRLEERIDDVDPGIVADVSPRPRHETAFRSDLVDVVSWRTDATENEAWVTLDVSTLDGGSNGTLIGRFDELAGGDRTPSLRALLSAVPAYPRIHSTEVHHWIRDGGTWRRDAATLHFVAH